MKTDDYVSFYLGLLVRALTSPSAASECADLAASQVGVPAAMFSRDAAHAREAARLGPEACADSCVRSDGVQLITARRG